MQLRSWRSPWLSPWLALILGIGSVAGCTTTPKDDGGDGKDVVDALGPNLRASLAPGTYKLPMAFDATSFAYDEAVLSLTCQGRRADSGDKLQSQSDETGARNSRITFTPGAAGTAASGTHTLTIVLKSRLSTKLHADDFDQTAPCFVEVRVDLIAKADDSRWRIVYSPRFGATEDEDGAATAQALQAALARAPAMKFSTIMMDAGGTGKICAAGVERCPWSASRPQE